MLRPVLYVNRNIEEYLVILLKEVEWEPTSYDDRNNVWLKQSISIELFVKNIVKNN